MNGEDPRLAAVDARLRGLFADLDTREGFESRLMQRVAGLPLPARAAQDSLRAQFERRRELVRRRLRREAWSNAVTITGIGIAAGAAVVSYAPEIMRWATSNGFLALDPMLIATVTVAAVAAGALPFLRRSREPL